MYNFILILILYYIILFLLYYIILYCIIFYCFILSYHIIYVPVCGCLGDMFENNHTCYVFPHLPDKGL